MAGNITENFNQLSRAHERYRRIYDNTFTFTKNSSNYYELVHALYL